MQLELTRTGIIDPIPISQSIAHISHPALAAGLLRYNPNPQMINYRNDIYTFSGAVIDETKSL